MTKASNLTAIEKTTGKTWNDWVRLLDKANGKDLTHRQIADIAYAELKDKLENAGWWSQGVAVAYEQHIGRRKPGQRSDGSYEATASKTFQGSLDDAMNIWTTFFKGIKDFDGVKITKPPTSSATEKYRHWACGLEDGTRVNADAYLSPKGKASLAITHTKLTSEKDQSRWKTYWQGILKSLT